MIQKLFRKYLPTCLLLTMAMSLMSFTVVIDAGHGGHDAGAVGLKMKVQEKDLNLTDQEFVFVANHVVKLSTKNTSSNLVFLVYSSKILKEMN